MFRYICIFLSLLCCTFGWAQDFSDDIEEAQPLIQGSTSSVEYDVKKWNHRSYTLLGYANVKNTNSNHYESYYAEFDTTVKYESSKKLKSFFDIYAAYLENGDEDVFYVNQLGMSYQIDLKNQFGFGKERRRISPGFIFSPSDIVHVQESLPGFREQRAGVWNLRWSWQSSQHSFDLAFIPYIENTKEGWPQKDTQQGGYARYFVNTDIFDASLTIGVLEGVQLFGAHGQLFISKTVRAYTEMGYAAEKLLLNIKTKDWTQSLIGLSVEAFTHFTIRQEFIYQPQALNSKQSEGVSIPSITFQETNLLMGGTAPLLRQYYSLTNLQFFDFWNDTSINFTLLSGLDHDFKMGAVNFNKPLSNQWVLQMNHLILSGNDKPIVFIKPFANQTLVSLRYYL